MATAKKAATKKSAGVQGLKRTVVIPSTVELFHKEITLDGLGALVSPSKKDWEDRMVKAGFRKVDITRGCLSEFDAGELKTVVEVLRDMGVKHFEMEKVTYIAKGKIAGANRPAKKAGPSAATDTNEDKPAELSQVVVSLPHNDYNVTAAIDNPFSAKFDWKGALKAAKVPVSKKLHQLTEGQFKSFLETVAAKGIWGFTIKKVTFIRGGKLTKHKVNSYERMLGLTNAK